MAGLTKQQLAGKTAFLKTDPPPTDDWKDLTNEVKQAWIDRAAASDETPGKPDAPTVENPSVGTVAAAESSSNSSAGTSANDTISTPDSFGEIVKEVYDSYRKGPELPAVPKDDPMPPTDPELGDLTPKWAIWYSRTHSTEAFIKKYEGRELLVQAAINRGGAE